MNWIAIQLRSDPQFIKHLANHNYPKPCNVFLGPEQFSTRGQSFRLKEGDEVFSAFYKGPIDESIHRFNCKRPTHNAIVFKQKIVSKSA